MMKQFTPWKSVQGVICHPTEESKEPWDGDRNGPERPYMRDYSQTLTYKIMLAFQNLHDPTKSHVIQRYDQALELIREIDTLTLGIPKIVYLVGWNAMGHDDKYPNWDIFNPFLCRPGYTDSLADLRWLMQEARQYNTSVSLHLNSSDIYKDSPLWDEYLENDLISKRNGELYVNGTWSEKDSYSVNLKNAWEKGFFKEKIDLLLEMLPEIVDAGSIHTDAFLCRWSDQSSFKEEQAARRQIVRYWRDCGVDLTSEFIYGSSEGAIQDGGYIRANEMQQPGLIGLQPYAWHLAQSEENWFRRPASLLAAGGFPHISNWTILEEGYEKIAFLYGCSMQVEDMLLEAFTRKGELDGSFEEAFLKRFYTTTAMYTFLNQFQNLRIEEKNGISILEKTENVVATYGKNPESCVITKCGCVIRKNNDVFVPLVWKSHPAVAAFSEAGYTDRVWQLLPEWAGVDAVDMYAVTMQGLKRLYEGVSVKDRTLTLSLEAGQVLYIVPVGITVAV